MAPGIALQGTASMIFEREGWVILTYDVSFASDMNDECIQGIIQTLARSCQACIAEQSLTARAGIMFVARFAPPRDDIADVLPISEAQALAKGVLEQ
jgi:hypothetical protein